MRGQSSNARRKPLTKDTEIPMSCVVLDRALSCFLFPEGITVIAPAPGITWLNLPSASSWSFFGENRSFQVLLAGISPLGHSKETACTRRNKSWSN